ncbi:MAG: hypothetical protein F4004_08890 [Acidimicrobiia bacterium]|nr:hypothetical protein [Acidimicrobiia bacterium]MYC44921.1 hypothetical protein [Acidimicrobiia bacterium]
MIAGAIRAKGYEALAMADVYPDGLDLRLPDSDWIRRAGREGWVAISKDNQIPRDHADMLSAATLRLFLIPNSNMSGADMVTRLMDNWDAILRRTEIGGPYVYAILPSKLEKRWP